MSYSNLPAPSCFLSGAVRVVFNFLLADCQLLIGWTILDIFMEGLEKLSVEWRRT
jgi:hypothetical protein